MFRQEILYEDLVTSMKDILKCDNIKFGDKINIDEDFLEIFLKYSWKQYNIIIEKMVIFK